MTIWIVLKLIVIAFLMQLLPGWALLSLGEYYKRWTVIQRWILAFFLGMAVYPVIFYLARVLLPGLQIGLNKLIIFLVLCMLFALWQFRKTWRENFAFEAKDIIVLGILTLTMVTRLIPAWQYPYPAWSDSLHHSIITKSVMLNGQLPYTMPPGDPASLSGYHLGLYSLTASLGLLANVAPHTALLYYSQIINAFAGLSVFILFDKKVGRLGAIASMVFAGLISFQPALYFNWGRFTQLASQTILFPAALMAWEALEPSSKKKYDITAIVMAGLAIAAMALLHFRVLAFFLPLFALIFLFVIGKKEVTKTLSKQIFIRSLLVALIAISISLPAIVPALQSYNDPAEVIDEQSMKYVSDSTDLPLTEHVYYKFEYATFFIIGLSKVVAALATLGLLVGLCFKKTRTLALITIGWLAFLFIAGNLANLNIYKLAFVNMTGVMILAYLPGALGFGLLFEAPKELLERQAQPHTSPMESTLTWALVFVAFLFVTDRIQTIEEYRHFMTNEDHQAMVWIKEETPPEAVFGVNTYYWAGGAFHGTDGGYWIPYFAERDTTTRTMMSLYSPDINMMIQRNALVRLFYHAPEEPMIVQRLCDMGINYLYSGNKQFNGLNFDIETIMANSDAKLVYDQGGVQILELCSQTSDMVFIKD